MSAPRSSQGWTDLALWPPGDQGSSSAQELALVGKRPQRPGAEGAAREAALPGSPPTAVSPWLERQAVVRPWFKGVGAIPILPGPGLAGGRKQPD